VSKGPRPLAGPGQSPGLPPPTMPPSARKNPGGNAMARMTGGEAIVDGLLRHGIDTIFGLPGVQVYGLFDAFARNANRLRLIQAAYLGSRAFQEMPSGRRGPVALEMPWDQFSAVADVTPQDPLPLHPNPVPDTEKMEALAKLLDAARAPMLWVGGGALHAAA